MEVLIAAAGMSWTVRITYIYNNAYFYMCIDIIRFIGMYTGVYMCV